MFPNRRPNHGWILCPSKSFPGKFYYFNVVTGETAWSLNEPEVKFLKNAPIQRVDHGYPEPNSPPTEDTPTTLNHQQTVKFNPCHERTMSNYPQEISGYQTSLLPSVDQISTTLPYQVQIPMILPGSNSMPQVIMIVMNQAMRQLSIDEPRQYMRQRNCGLMRNQLWTEQYPPSKESNQIWKGPSRQWKEPNQQLKEINQQWKEPNQQWKRANQAWTEPIQDSVDLNEPDRELFIQTNKTPLGERFVNYKAPKSDLKNNDIALSSQYDFENQKEISTNRTVLPIIGKNEFSKSNKNQENSLLRKPIFSFVKNNTHNSNQYVNDIKESRKSVNSNTFMPGSSQNVSHSIQVPSMQTKMFRQSRTRQDIFGQSIPKQILFGQSQITQGLYGLNQPKQRVLGHSKEGTIRQTQGCPNLFQSSSFELNPFQELIKEKADLKQNSEFGISNSPKPNIEHQRFEERNYDAHSKKTSTLTFNNKAEISQDTHLQNLDKNDLRRTLLEKKRKSKEILVPIENKKIKTYKQEQTTMATPKKKVKFNLVTDPFFDPDNNDSSRDELGYQQVLQFPKDESWYMVTDVKTLLENFEFLYAFAKSDPNCTLMIPSEVMSEVVALSRGGSRGATLVASARRLLRTLATPQTQIDVQHSEHDSLDISTVDSILNCCLELMDKAYVVLITSDKELHTKANYLNVRYLTIEVLKIDQAKREKVHFDVKKDNTDKEENIKVPTEELKNLSFSCENNTHQKRSSIDNTDNNNRIIDDYKVNRADNVNFINTRDTTDYQTQKIDRNIHTKKYPQSRSSISKSETETKENQKCISNKEMNITYEKNEHLETLIKCFYEKNKIIEHLVEERSEEFECNFRQIMEECLNVILQSTNVETVAKYPPPWSLEEALECTVKLYDNHTYIRDVVAIFMSVANAKTRTGRDLICIVGCGVALVQYLKLISSATEVLKDTEDALNMFFRTQNENIDVDIDTEALTPAYTLAEIIYVKKNRRNFVKDRTEVLKYLKKHFPAWADYDITREEDTSNVSWEKSSESNNMIVRTSGKNLGMLKLSSSKRLNMKPDSTQNIYVSEHVQQNTNFCNDISRTEHMDIDSKVSKESFTKDNLTRNVQNTTSGIINIFGSNKKRVTSEDNRNKPVETKVIRIINNVDFNMHNKKEKLHEMQIFDEWSMPGHTFGVTEQNGPNIIKNIKPIKEFEEKFKMQQKSLELEEMCLNMSKSDENNNLSSESTNNNCMSMSIEENDNKRQNGYLDAKNDNVDEKNDAKKDRSHETNDTQHVKSNHIITANNESRLISHKDCIANNTYESVYLDEIRRKLNLNADCELNDLMAPKDDTTHDSVLNASQQAYHLIDSFLFELKVTFKVMFVFIESSARGLRHGSLSMAESLSVQHQAATTRRQVARILDNLGGIIRRENSNRRKLKDFVSDAGSMAGRDTRIDQYGEIVAMCYQHARLIEQALNSIFSIVNKRRLGN